MQIKDLLIILFNKDRYKLNKWKKLGFDFELHSNYAGYSIKLLFF
jgi:hypothetical protein